MTDRSCGADVLSLPTIDVQLPMEPHVVLPLLGILTNCRSHGLTTARSASVGPETSQRSGPEPICTR